ncbi:MAG: redox-regulated ATPase YchF [Lentisphaeria bacterium]|nr:redox-regulated ATPase YchF [Lentisphaeria bacterium]
MNLGIIGLPQAGKRTVFGLLTGVSAERAPTRDGIAYGVARVRDPRVDRLSGMYNPRRTRYAEFEIALPPDLQPDTARGAAWLEPLRRVDAFVEVFRGFASDRVFHVSGSVDPSRDVSLVETELLFADLALAEMRLERLEKETRSRGADGTREREQAVLRRCLVHLEGERALRTLVLEADELRLVRSLQFLTLKPVVAVLNVGEDMAAAEETLAPLASRLEVQGARVVFLSAAIESEIAELAEGERESFLADLGIEEPAAHRLSRAAYEALGLISFFTVGPDEVRAWSVERGAAAPTAAGRIHSDLERGFIRADTIAYGDLIEAGSERAAREAKLYRLQGREYQVRDGDILEIRFSV